MGASHVKLDLLIHYGEACLGSKSFQFNFEVLYIFKKIELNYDVLLKEIENINSEENEQILVKKR